MLFLVFFLIIIAFIIWKPGKLNEGQIALIGLIILLIIGLLKINDIPTALLGNELFKPFEIIVILLSLSVISTTLDDLGFFKFVAYKAIIFSDNKKAILFRSFFILTILLTSFTSNDVDILTLTPIVLWFLIITKLKPLPYLFSVFVVANTASLSLLIGNLTNIIIGQVFNISFISFLIYMIIPHTIILISQYFILKKIFKKQLQGKILTDEEIAEIHGKLDQRLPNKKKNIITIVIMILVIIFSSFNELLSIKLWTITTIGASIVLLINIKNIKKRLQALPWNVVIFALVFIVLTYKLQQTDAVIKISQHFSIFFKNIWSSVFFSSFFSAISSGIINNIPTSFSLSSIFFNITTTLDASIHQATAFGLVLGTNLGALFSPVGALATILWVTLIRQKGYNIKIKDFIPLGILVGTISIIVGCIFVGLEIMIF